MKKYLLATTFAALSAPAFAGPSCTPPETAMPVWQVIRNFEEQGGEVVKFKIDDACYEIYGRIGGKKVEIYFDPATGKEIERNES